MALAWLSVIDCVLPQTHLTEELDHDILRMLLNAEDTGQMLKYLALLTNLQPVCYFCLILYLFY